MAKVKHPPGSEPFDVTLPEGFQLGEHAAAVLDPGRLRNMREETSPRPQPTVFITVT